MGVPRRAPHRRRRGAATARRRRHRGARRRARPVPRSRPAPSPSRATTPCRPTSTSGPRGSPDDVELRVDPDEHRLGRRRHAGAPLGPRPPDRARRRRPPSPARPARCTARSAWRRGTRSIPPGPSRCSAAGDLAEDWTAYVLASPADAPPRGRRPLRDRDRTDHVRRVGGRGHRRAPAHPRRPRLPLHHPVPAGAATRLARAPLARLPPGRAGRDGQRRRHRAAHRRGGGRRGDRGLRVGRHRASWTTTATPRHPRPGPGRRRRGHRCTAAAEALDRTDAPAAMGGGGGRRRRALARQGPLAGRRPRGAPGRRRHARRAGRPARTEVARWP